MDLQRLRMDLVHRHVEMLVLLLAMANRDVLVLSEARRPHGPADDVVEFATFDDDGSPAKQQDTVSVDVSYRF